MIAGNVYFVFRPNQRLLQRLQSLDRRFAYALEEPVILPVQLPEEAICEEMLDAVKTLFVARVAFVTLGEQESGVVFGTLRPSIDEFDAWWTCEVLVHDAHLPDLLAALRSAGVIESLGADAVRLLQRLDRSSV